MEKIETDIAILGAGLTGLTIADLLVALGRDVVLVEKNGNVGGLAKTIEYKGFRFDLGGHRLYFYDNDLLEYIKTAVDGNLICHKRKSSIFLNGRFLEYPPYFLNAFSYGLPSVIKFIFENFIFPRKKIQNVRSLKDWVHNYFGPTVHNIYFRDYSQKVWGLSTELISANWADRRIGSFDNIKLVKDIFIKSRGIKENKSLFYYPSLGIGSICEGLFRRIKNKAILYLPVDLTSFNIGNKKIESITYIKDGEHFKLRFKHLISTIPLLSLSQYIFRAEGLDSKKLPEKIRYRSMILIYLILRQEKVFEEHWVYFPDKDIIFARASEPKNWSKFMAQDGKTALCLEIFCEYNDNIWNLPEDIIVSRIVATLVRLGFISYGEVIDHIVRKISFAYPLFYLGYEKNMKPVLDVISEYGNLSLAGRNGKHSYYDIEECVKDAHRVVSSIV